MKKIFSSWKLLGILATGLIILGLLFISQIETQNLLGSTCITCGEGGEGGDGGPRECFIDTTVISPSEPIIELGNTQSFTTTITTTGCPANQLFNYYWNFGDGDTVLVTTGEETSTLEHTYSDPENFSLFVEVTDGGLNDEGGNTGGGNTGGGGVCEGGCQGGERCKVGICEEIEAR